MKDCTAAVISGVNWATTLATNWERSKELTELLENLLSEDPIWFDSKDWKFPDACNNLGLVMTY